ncbi:hypothetical protein [Rugamonas sp. DEMB1]|uniref:hypothetical protein n=1 Tax=Rugamonas sp. DEMB1 TaxID=3039386 RepID=UPI00244B15D4|nr:hypothetical protein [Rugamonas sp. DEMB1]WGG51802.1 hypothetical protein QC826_06165 [Rugamonas sp. DEMB1]
MAVADFTTAELQRAYRDCKLLNTTFEQAMGNAAMAIAIRRLADCNRRRLARTPPARFDHKRAAANDID